MIHRTWLKDCIILHIWKGEILFPQISWGISFAAFTFFTQHSYRDPGTHTGRWLQGLEIKQSQPAHPGHLSIHTLSSCKVGSFTTLNREASVTNVPLGFFVFSNKVKLPTYIVEIWELTSIYQHGCDKSQLFVLRNCIHYNRVQCRHLNSLP